VWYLFADKSNLLLCQVETLKVDMMTAGSAVAGLLTAPPQCINVRSLQVYRGGDWHVLLLNTRLLKKNTHNVKGYISLNFCSTKVII